MISLVWSLGTMLLEPAYDATIRRNLIVKLETIAQTLDKAWAEGVSIGEWKRSLIPGDNEQLSSAARELLEAQIDSGNLSLDNTCLDISNAGLWCIFCKDKLPSNCAVHPYSSTFSDSPTLNGTNAITLRAAVFMNTEKIYVEWPAPNQRVMGRTAAGGNYAVIVSVNIESINQSVQVLQKLMFPLSLSILAVSILAASIFSHWFTRPISRLSQAAKEMAKGNYDVNVQVYGRDEITHLAQDFNAMAEEVKKAAEFQRDLIANVSHDLRTPLTLIKGYAETIRDLSGDDPEKRNEQLSVIVDETDRLSSLVGSVLEMTRISSGHEKKDAVVFDLAQLCDEVGFRYEMVAQSQGYSFDLSAESGLMICADPQLIERALHNFLGNALNHIGADGYIGLKAIRTPANTARVEIIDHGEGISAEDLPHLFDKYYRSRKDSGKTGTGLGLSIAKAIFVAHGFRYGVESTLGKGATFWFEAPLCAPPKDKQALPPLKPDV